MEDAVTMDKFDKLLEQSKRNEDISQRIETRLDKILRDVTLGGENKWFVCLTKNKVECDDPLDE